MNSYPDMPIIYIEDDIDDKAFFEDMITENNIGFPIMNFDSGQVFLDYLMETKDKPIIIFCDINMPKMSGIGLRKKILENEYLRKKSIPFIFYSTSASEKDIEQAYDLTVQGYFKKTDDIKKMSSTLEMIIRYWSVCLHPNHRELNYEQ